LSFETAFENVTPSGIGCSSCVALEGDESITREMRASHERGVILISYMFIYIHVYIYDDLFKFANDEIHVFK